MTIDVERMESWIGGDVFDNSGEKVGKVDEVYFAGTDPVAIAITSGLAGRKHHAAVLKGAAVTFDGVRLAVAAGDLVKTDGEALTADDLSALAGQDPQLTEMRPEQIEGARQREQRHKDAEAALARADALDAEATARASAADKAVSHAQDATSAADSAARERSDAEKRAVEARATAEQLHRD